jgi:hypothetical protein
MPEQIPRTCKKKLTLKIFGFPQLNTTFKLAFLQRLLDWNLLKKKKKKKKKKKMPLIY